MPMPIRDVKSRIDALQFMRQLSPEDFALEDKLADSIAADKNMREKLKATQLRKVFQEIKGIERKIKKARSEEPFDSTQLLRVRPMLAYAVGRDLLPKEFYEVLKACFDRIETNEDFLRFAEFVEAVMAYHKFRSSERR